MQLRNRLQVKVHELFAHKSQHLGAKWTLQIYKNWLFWNVGNWLFKVEILPCKIKTLMTHFWQLKIEITNSASVLNRSPHFSVQSSTFCKSYSANISRSSAETYSAHYLRCVPQILTITYKNLTVLRSKLKICLLILLHQDECRWAPLGRSGKTLKVKSYFRYKM